MSKFNKRTLLIFVTCLLLGTLLIGFGIAYVIQLKQRLLPGQQRGGLEPAFLEFVQHNPVRSSSNLVI